MDRIKEMLDRITLLGDSEVAALEGMILTEFDTVEKLDPTTESVGSMTSLADALDAVRGEVSRRATERESLTAQAAEAAARVKGTKVEDSQDTPNAGDDAVPDDATAPDLPGETMDTPDDTGELPPPDAPTQGPPSPIDAGPVPAVDGSDPMDDESDPADAEDDAADPSDVDPKKKKGNPFAASNGAEATTTIDAPVAAQAAVAETPAPAAPVQEPAETPVEASPPPPAAEATAPAAVASTETTDAATDTPEGTEASNAATPTPNTPQEAAVTAAAPQQETPVIEAPADRRPTPKASVAVAITAGADIPNVSAGSAFSSMDDVANAFDQRLHALRRVTAGDGEQHIVASLSYEFPESRRLNFGDERGNTNKIDSIVAPQAIMASGGFCAPLEQRYDFFELLGSTDRPVRDSLAKFQADRGGISYAAAPVLKGGDTDYFAASSVWTEAMDKAPGNFIAGTGNLKPCIVVDCPERIEARTEALTVCLQFGNLMTRAYPELIKRHNELALIAHAREAEENLLAKIKAAGVQVTSARVLGAARDYFATLEAAAVGMRYRHRMDKNTPLRVIAPFWLLNLVRGDLVKQMPGDGADFTFEIADARIEQWFRVRNINVTWTIDGSTSLANAQGAGAVNGIPTSVEWDLFPEGTFLFLDGGTLDLGIIRDSSLVATNDYKTFVETFEGLAMLGPESLHVTSQLSMVGAAQALIDAAALTTATTD